ncbi:MAG: hypothetical protein V5A13_01980 [Haloarculaceae archaeon]
MSGCPLLALRDAVEELLPRLRGLLAGLYLARMQTLPALRGE